MTILLRQEKQHGQILEYSGGRNLDTRVSTCLVCAWCSARVTAENYGERRRRPDGDPAERVGVQAMHFSTLTVLQKQKMPLVFTTVLPL